MNTYRITCREYSYFVKEVKANSEDEANEKLLANVFNPGSQMRNAIDKSIIIFGCEIIWWIKCFAFVNPIIHHGSLIRYHHLLAHHNVDRNLYEYLFRQVL